MFYKSPDDRLHEIEAGFQYLLPPGAIEISAEDAAAIIAAQTQLTPHQAEQIKRKLLAEAMVKRDILLGHLRWFYIKADEERKAAQAAFSAAVGQAAIDAAQVVLNTAAAKVTAIDTAIDSLQNAFNDPRVVAAVDGEVKDVLDTVKDEIGFALAMASPATYYALKALDPI